MWMPMLLCCCVWYLRTSSCRSRPGRAAVPRRAHTIAEGDRRGGRGREGGCEVVEVMEVMG